jgi:hypothetical protein
MNRKYISSLVSKIARVFCFSFVYLQSTPSIAENNQSKFKYLVEFYAQRAFAYNTRTKLIKLDVKEAIPFSLECNLISEYLCAGSYLSILRTLQVSPTVKFYRSENSKLRFILEDDAAIAKTSSHMLDVYRGGFADTSDSGCQVFYALTGSSITSAAILMSIDQDDLKQKICVTVQLGQAMGLSTPANAGFESAWTTEPSGYRHLDDAGYKELQLNYSILEYMHMCPALNAGMNLHNVISILVTEPNCTRALTGLR